MSISIVVRFATTQARWPSYLLFHWLCRVRTIATDKVGEMMLRGLLYGYTVGSPIGANNLAKRRGNKSNAIRAILAEHPAATMKEIQAALKAKRIKASVSMISKIKAGANGKPRKAHTNGKANGATIEHLLAVKGLVAKVGSVEAARSALDLFAKLVEA